MPIREMVINSKIIRQINKYKIKHNHEMNKAQLWNSR